MSFPLFKILDSFQYIQCGGSALRDIPQREEFPQFQYIQCGGSASNNQDYNNIVPNFNTSNVEVPLLSKILKI